MGANPSDSVFPHRRQVRELQSGSHPLGLELFPRPDVQVVEVCGGSIHLGRGIGEAESDLWLLRWSRVVHDHRHSVARSVASVMVLTEVRYVRVTASDEVTG